MKHAQKRVRIAGLAVAAAAVVLPFLSTPAASAAGVLAGAGSIAPTSGNSATGFSINLPVGAACTGDTADGGYVVSSYMVPISVNPSTLTFDSGGPTPNNIGAAFRQPLYQAGGSPFAAGNTANASPAGGPGPVVALPTFDLSAFGPGNIPAGAYNVGIACVKPSTGFAMDKFWNTTITITTDAATGGPAEVHFVNGAVPNTPVLSSATPGNASITAAFALDTTANPAVTGYTATATPTVGSPITATGATSPIVIPGLTNGTSYSVTVHSTNTAGPSAESNAISATPVPPASPAVTGFTAAQTVVGGTTADLSWTAPASGPAVTQYNVSVTPAGPAITGGSPVTGSSATLTGLTIGTTYTVTITGVYTAPDSGTPASFAFTPTPASVLIQDITAQRPTGTLVLTQVCGTNAAIPAETGAQLGFPNGLPAIGAVADDLANGTGPTTLGGGSIIDPAYTAGQYPYPDSPLYPTHCGIDLGSAKLVTSGAGAGQFFATSGVMSQVTVVNTNDADVPWTVNGTMSQFNGSVGPAIGTHFSGNQLGIGQPLASQTAAFDDGDPATPTYSMAVTPGGPVAPNSLTGMATPHVLASATAGHSLGISSIDARLKLLIPINAVRGTYTGTLTISAI